MAGLQCWTRKGLSSASLARLGTPQGPTNLQVLWSFSTPNMLTGVFRAHPPPPPQHTGTAACSTFDVAESCRRDSARRKSECGLWLPRGRVGKGLPKPQQPSATLGYRETPSGIRERVYVRRDQEKVDRDVQVSFC